MRTRLAELDDRLNALFVKEVRQALRSKSLAIVFGATLFVACVVIGLTAVAVDDPGSADMGAAIMGGSLICCLLALAMIVPFQAFMSMAAERDENTQDLLILSNLRPLHVVLGKLGAALVWQALFLCAFTPFFVFGFLLPGGDILNALVGSAVGVVVSTSLCGIALSLAARVNSRGGRVAGLAALGGIMFVAIMLQSRLVLNRRSGVVFTSLEPELIGCSIAAALGLNGVLAACGRLASQQENRSTGTRIAASVVVCACVAWALHAAFAQGDALGCERFSALALVIAFLFSAYFASEPEALGRVARGQTSAALARAWAQLPWMPGGARGLVWFSVHAFSVCLFAAVSVGWCFGGVHVGLKVLRDLATIAAYGFVYVGAVTAFFTLPFVPARVRVFSPIVVYLVVFATIVLPMVWGFLAGGALSGTMSGPFHPLWVLEHDPKHWYRIAILVPVFAITVVANLPRLLRALRETREASIARVARDRRRVILLAGGTVDGASDVASAN